MGRDRKNQFGEGSANRLVIYLNGLSKEEYKQLNKIENASEFGRSLVLKHIRRESVDINEIPDLSRLLASLVKLANNPQLVNALNFLASNIDGLSQLGSTAEPFWTKRTENSQRTESEEERIEQTEGRNVTKVGGSAINESAVARDMTTTFVAQPVMPEQPPVVGGARAQKPVFMGKIKD